MENKRAFILAGICFVISLVLISGYVSQKEAEMTADFGEKVPVVVVRREGGIAEYATIREKDLDVVTVFKKFRQPSAVTDPAEVIGKSAYVPLYNGEQVVLTKLVTADGKPVLDKQVERATRAITLKINPFTGVGRLIRPGDRVDIIITPNYDVGGVMVWETKTLAQNIPVLATGRAIQNSVPTRVEKDVLETIEGELATERRKDWGSAGKDALSTHRPDDDYSTLTLQVTPEDAKKLLLVSHLYGDNRIYFTLRNSADTEIVKLDTSLLDDVLGPDSDYGKSKIKPPPVTPPRPRSQDFQGGSVKPIY